MYPRLKHGEALPRQEVPETHQAQLPGLGRCQQSAVAIERKGRHLQRSAPLQKGTGAVLIENGLHPGELNLLFLSRNYLVPLC